MHTLLPFLLAMIAAIVMLNMLATKLKIAYPILLVVAGLLVSFVPGLPMVRINPDLIFFIFLPPLLFEASWTISFKEMKKWWRIIGSFAFLVVFFTAMSVAVVANHFIPGFTIASGFLLGGIVSPPDAVSTGAITKFVKIPRSTSTVLEGESLLNDASSLIVFRFALVAVGTGQFIWQDAALTFIWMAIGGAGLGLLLAWIFVQAHKRLPLDAQSAIALTLIEPYFMYWVAEQVHCSGVLAVVSGGLYMSARRLIFLDSASRIQSFSVWESFVFILNGVVFLIIGLELPEIVEGLRARAFRYVPPLAWRIGDGRTDRRAYNQLLCCLAGYDHLSTRRDPACAFQQKALAHAHAARLDWYAGVVSLAAALAIPITLENGDAFPHRNIILMITFVAILLTLLVQGLTLPYFIRRTALFDGLTDEASEELTKREMKRGLKQHVYKFLKTKYENELNGHAGMEKFLKQWEERSKAADDSWMNNKTKAIFVEVLEIQRQYLVELNKDPQIDEDIIRQQLYQIDLEEERLKII